jgi:hypothetical protein
MVDDAQQGNIASIPTTLPKYNKFVYGTRQGTIYLYGAETGVGKTTFVREKHMHEVYEFFKAVNDTDKLDLMFVDFSLEITPEINMGAAIIRKIFLDHRVVISMDELFRWDSQRPVLDQAKYNLVQSYKPYFEEFQKRLLVVDGEVNPTLFHNVLMKVARANGTWEKEGDFISECSGYKPNNPHLYVIVLYDTMNLTEIEPPHDTVKTSIDRNSRIAVYFRNKCNFTFIEVQQFNAEISAVDRNRYGIKTPLLRDFEDSKRPTKDADVVFGLFDPMRHMREDERMFNGYDITILKSWFRSLHLLKNRKGQSNKFIPLKFDGEVGVFTQLPGTEAMDQQAYMLATRH